LEIKKKRKRERVTDRTLDKLVRDYLLAKNSCQCERCHQCFFPDMLEVAHLYRRRHKVLRWDLRNAHLLCKSNPATGRLGCHPTIDNDQIKLVSFMYEVLPKEDIEGLQRLANMTLKEYPIDREALKLDLKDKILKLEGENGDV